MKEHAEIPSMKRSAVGFGLLFLVAAAYACSPSGGGAGDGGDPDAAPPAGDSGAPLPDAPSAADAPADTARPDAGTDASVGDAADGSVAEDASGPDAADASVVDSGPDAADASVGDAAPPGTVTPLVDNVVHYDVNATHIYYRSGTTNYSCELPACTNVRTVSPVNGGYPFMAASNDKFYYFLPVTVNQNTLRSRTPAGGLVVTEDTIGWTGAVLPQSLFVGSTYLETYYRLNPFVTGTPTYRTIRHNYVTNRAAAVGTRHENFGASVTLGTGLAAPTGTGGPFPTLPTAGTSIGASPVGPTVTHPTVVVLRDGALEACPTAAPCAAWVSLGALGTVFNLDATHLYVGSATSLGRCELAEIAAAGTCTLTSLAADDVSAPMYITPTHVFYRSGTMVKSVTK